MLALTCHAHEVYNISVAGTVTAIVVVIAIGICFCCWQDYKSR